MTHRTGFIALVALLAGCNPFASDGAGSVDGEWGGVGASLTVRHDSTFWNHDCFAGVVPVPIQVSSDGSFLAHGVMTNSGFRGQSVRMYGAVHGDSMQLYFQIQGAAGTWSGPGTSPLIRGQAPTDSGILCID